MASSTTSRPLTVLVWGATGFTGRLVAEYLLRTYGTDTFAWGLGGRSEPKLREVRAALTRIDARAASLPLVVGDAMDPAAMERVAGEARVVATTAGPFGQHGRELIGACARAGTHYCDITGEIPFVRDAIDRHQDAAVASGARLVPCAGFDSIPSDLGVLLLHDALAKKGSALARAHLYVMSMGGGLGGGTAASALSLMEEASRNPKLRDLLANPYSLDPKDGAGGPEGPDGTKAHYDPDLGAWTAPFIMGPVNTRVVRRTNALLGYPYGKDFRYEEAIRVGKGLKGRVRAIALAGGAALAQAALKSGTLRRLAGAALPRPGEGPTDEVRKKGAFSLRLLGEGRHGERVWAAVGAKGDPGHTETAKMLAETALCLTEDEDRLPKRAGVLTPASACGMILVERLRKAGMTFAVEPFSSPAPSP